MKNAQLQRVWQSMKDVPMLFVTLAVLLVLVILSEKGFEDARVWVVAGLVLVTVIDTLIGRAGCGGDYFHAGRGRVLGILGRCAHDLFRLGYRGVRAKLGRT